MPQTLEPWRITADNQTPPVDDGEVWNAGYSVTVYRGEDVARNRTSIIIDRYGESTTTIHLESVDAACRLLELAAEIVAEWARHEHGPGKVASP